MVDSGDPDPRIRLLAGVPVEVAIDAAIATHVAAVDPHGDRAYSDGVAATKVPTSRTITAGTGLSGGGTLAADRTLTVVFGTTAGTSCQGNDSRLSDSRAPTTHAATHASGGGDPITISTSQITGLAAVATSGSAADLTTGTLPAGRLPAHTGDVTTSVGTVATSISANVVTNAKLAQMGANTFKGNNTAGTANAVDMSAAQAKAVLAIANTDVSGLGTMSTQAASAVAITGGAVDGTTVGATTPSTGGFTSLTVSTKLKLCGSSGAAPAHIKQTADSNTGGFRLERTATSDSHSLYMQGGLGSLNDALTFNSSFSGDVAAIDRSGIAYFKLKVLVGSTTDDGVAALQVTGNMRCSAGLGAGVASVATAAGTTALSGTSAVVQVFTGVTTQTVTLPAANAMGAGIAQILIIKNVSTGALTINRAGADTINTTSTAQTTFSIAANSQAMLVSNGVSAWEKVI